MAEDQEFTLPPLEERPLVTFALFAYNQEKYIREAVEGAFAQTYEPLEIILSDDCSTDRTFEVLQDCMNNYSGPHRIRLNRNPKNLGIGSHVSYVFALSSGKIIVMAAGDDISVPNRASLIVERAYKEPEAMAFCSAYTAIESGEIVTPKPPTTVEELLSREKWIVGATAAYRRELYENYGPLGSDVQNEDAAFALRALLSGEIATITEQPLVHYRQETGLSAKAKKTYTNKAYRKSSWIELRHQRGLIRQWRRDLRKAKQGKKNSLFFDLRVAVSFLISLQCKKRIPSKIIKMHIRQFGAKRTLYEYLGNMKPGLLNTYLRFRYRNTTY